MITKQSRIKSKEIYFICVRKVETQTEIKYKYIKHISNITIQYKYVLSAEDIFNYISLYFKSFSKDIYLDRIIGKTEYMSLLNKSRITKKYTYLITHNLYK